MSVALRDYQASTVDAVLANIDNGVQSQILSAPTGAGKTEMAFALLRESIRRGEKAEFVCSRREEVNQASRRLHAEGIPHGVLMGNDTVGVRAPIRVASAQTIRSRGMRAGNWLTVVDECHELHDAFLERAIASNTFLIGLSATPFPPRLGKYYDTLVNSVTTNALLQDGVLCPFDVLAAHVEVDTDGLKVQSTGDWAARDVSDRITRITGDAVDEWERCIRERFDGVPQPTVVFGATIADAEALAEAYQAAGHDFRVVTSAEDSQDNKAILARFAAGEFPGVVNCAMLARAWDAPHLRILQDCYPLRRSLLSLVQRYGRIMRRAPGKDRALVIDHAGNWLGFRGDLLRFYADGPPALTDEWAQKATREVKPRAESVCKQCRQVFERGDTACQYCGEPRPKPRKGVPQVTMIDGVLALVDSVTGERSAYDGKRLWRECCGIAAAKYPGDEERAKKRALASYRGITGVWPDGGRRLKFNPLPLDSIPGEVTALVESNFRAWLKSKRQQEARTYARR